MIFYFFTAIVFIAELIITLAIIINLFKLDKTIKKYNFFLEEARPLIKDMMETTRKLSEEFLKLVPKIVDNIKVFAINLLKDQLKNIIGGLTFYLVKKEVEKHV